MQIPEVRGDVDNATLALFHHLRDDCLTAEERACQVHSQDPVTFGWNQT
jgi:hypothetical protein